MTRVLLSSAAFPAFTVHRAIVEKRCRNLRRMAFLGIALISLQSAGEAAEAPPGMKWIKGGEFIMGSDQPDEHSVANAEFGQFVAAAGYQTTAEKPVDWEEMKTVISMKNGWRSIFPPPQ